MSITKEEKLFLRIADDAGVKGSKRQKKEMIMMIKELLETGLSESDIFDVLNPDEGGAFLPAIPVNSPLAKDWLLQVAAVPVLLAIELNLPICQETLPYGPGEISVLHAAFLFNLIDHFMTLKDEIMPENLDHKGIQDMKQAAMQVPDYDDAEEEVIFTWSNVDVSILEFLGESAFPLSIPEYSDGYLSLPIVEGYPNLVQGTLAGLTEEYIREHFLESYVKLVTQLSCGNADLICRTSKWESEFRMDKTLWAINSPTTDDPESYMSRYVNVQFYFPIPPSSEWLSLTPAVDEAFVSNLNIKTRFTAYSGLCHYADRLRKGIYGRVSEIVDPGFLHVSQLTDLFIKSLITADMDLFELKAQAIIVQNSDSPLKNLSRRELIQYFLINMLNIYCPYNTVMAYSMPSSADTFAGMEYLPNVNYANLPMFADFVEFIEEHGYIHHYSKLKGRAWVNKCPVLVKDPGYNPRISPNADLTIPYSSMFIDSSLSYNLKPSSTGTIPIDGQLLCYTRGPLAQRIWNTVPASLAPYFNTRIGSQFESFKKYSGWDKYTLCFRDGEGTTDPALEINRHFLAYERKNMAIGERNLMRQEPGQFIILGLESLTFPEKLERVRTFQSFKKYGSSEYVDSTQDPMVEPANNLFDLDNQNAQLYRRYKYQETSTDRVAHLLCTFHKGEGGNFWAKVKQIGGPILKTIGPIAAQTIGTMIGGPGLGNVVGSVAGSLLGNGPLSHGFDSVSLGTVPNPVTLRSKADYFDLISQLEYHPEELLIKEFTDYCEKEEM